MVKGKRIVLGITGGIAAYKAVYLLREFQKRGAEVRVTATPSALRFIGNETLSALSRHEVPVHIFTEDCNLPENSAWTKHIDWSEWADIFVIAPCTANTLAKIAHGLADNMLTATVLAARCPVVICPTMDGEMYAAPAVKANLARLTSYGYHIIEPEQGYLASGLQGRGRLPEVKEIIRATGHILVQESEENLLLKNKKIVVTGGPTREYMDAVRFLSNPSSGKMGLAMAMAAHEMGAEVIFIHGPVSIKIPPCLQTVSVVSARDLYQAVQKQSDADGFIMASAVSDFRPKTRVAHKIKKENAEKTIKLAKNPDILAWLGKKKRRHQTLIGFAMETENLVENARKKLSEKNVDWIAANSIHNGKGFQSDENEVILVGQDKELHFSGTKRSIAKEMLTAIFRNQISA